MRWEWNWRKGILFEHTKDDRYDHPLEKITEVVLTITPIEQRWSTSRGKKMGGQRYFCYNARTYLIGLEKKPLEIASTGTIQSSLEDVRFRGLCFAQMIANSVGVSIRIEEIRHEGDLSTSKHSS